MVLQSALVFDLWPFRASLPLSVLFTLCELETKLMVTHTGSDCERASLWVEDGSNHSPCRGKT